MAALTGLRRSWSSTAEYANALRGATGRREPAHHHLRSWVSKGSSMNASYRVVAVAVAMGSAIGCGKVQVDTDAGIEVVDALSSSCEPGAFLECSAEDTAEFCDEDGAEAVEQTCEFGCSATRSGCRECVPGQVQCIDNDLVTCGDDGAIEDGTTCTLGCDGGSDGEPPRCLILQPTNLPDDLCETTATSNAPIAADINTDAGCDAVVTQDDGPPICLLIRQDAVISDGDVRVTGERALAIVGTNSVTITGRLDGSAEGIASGPGAPDGEGSGSVNTASAEGGGGAGYGTTGAAGATPDAPGGGEPGGDSYGNPALSPLRGGSVGGNHTNQGLNGPPIHRGGGGGAIQIVSCGPMQMGDAAFVHVGGGGGLGGPGSDDQASAGAGGGSGGAILLEAASLTISGTLAANGGGGGGGGCSIDGRDGEDAKPSAEAASGGGGCESLPAPDHAGAGGAGGTLGSLPTIGDSSDHEEGAGGGGGGAVGRIRINVSPTFALDLSSAEISPEPSEGEVATR